MPSIITGLEYICLYEEIETEEQLIEVLKELKDVFSGFQQGFKIKDNSGREITDSKSFLENALTEKEILQKGPIITLKGSGNVGGLEIQQGSIQYDLSQVYNRALDWDKKRDGTCYGCTHIRKYHWVSR